MIRAPQFEGGYALVTAVLAMAVLSLMALTLTTNARGTMAGATATIASARLGAAADAGLMIAIHGLAQERERRWSIDGRQRALRFDGIDVFIQIEDERGKIPLNQVTDEQVRTIFEALGIDGTDLEVAVDSFLDWRDDDDDVRPSGAEAPYYAALGRSPRNGQLRTIDEVVLIRGITPAMVERLRPASTIYGIDREGFDDRYASPLALAAMSGGGLGSPAVIQRERELAGQRPAIELGPDETLVGRPLLIRVETRDGDAKVRRATVIELTGSRIRPYVIRQYE